VSVDVGQEGDVNNGWKVVGGSTGAGATTASSSDTVTVDPAAGPYTTGPTNTSASAAGRSVGQSAASQPTSAPVGPSATGTKGRSYRGRARKDSLVRQEPGAIEAGQKITSSKDSNAAFTGPSPGSSITLPADSTAGSSKVQHVGPAADAEGAKGQPRRNGEASHVLAEDEQKVANAKQGTVSRGPSAVASDTRPGALVAGSAEAQHAASTADTSFTEVAKGFYSSEHLNSRQGFEGQKNATVSKNPAFDSRPIDPTINSSKGQHNATKDESSKVAIEDNAVAHVGPFAGLSGAAATTASAGQGTFTTKTERAKGRSSSNKGGKDSHARQESGPSSIKVETSKANKDSTAAPAELSVEPSKPPASSAANDKFATISGSRSRCGGKRGLHRRGKSGSASTEVESKNVANTFAAPADSFLIGPNADRATRQPATADASQPQTGKGKKSRHGRKKSASVSTGESEKVMDNKESKESSAKRSSAPAVSTTGHDKTAFISCAPKADAKSYQASGVSISNSSGESKEKDGSAKSNELAVKSSNGQNDSAAVAIGGEINPVGSHLRSATGEESLHTRQASVSAFVEEWKESTAVYDNSPVKASGVSIASNTGLLEGQNTIMSPRTQHETSEEDFHDCQASVDSIEESKEAVGTKTATATSEESPIRSSGVPIASIVGLSEIRPAAAISHPQSEAATGCSCIYKEAEHTSTESEPKETESNNGGTSAETPAGHFSASVGFSVSQPDNQPTVAAGSSEAKDDTLQGKTGKDTQRSSESASARESKAPIRLKAARELIISCPAQAPENKLSQLILKAPKADANRRAPTTVHMELDKRAISRQHEQEGYMAPNGEFLNKNQLARYAEGMRIRHKDTVYFQPSFIEDPWAGMKPVTIPCSRRYW